MGLALFQPAVAALPASAALPLAAQSFPLHLTGLHPVLFIVTASGPSHSLSFLVTSAFL